VEDDLAAASTWLQGSEGSGIRVIDEASVSLVRERVRSEAVAAGLHAPKAAALVNVASELAHNQLRYARAGVVAVRRVERDRHVGVEVVAADRGPGIGDVAGALDGGAARTTSLGVGLSAVHELADEVDMDVRLGEGMCVWARQFSEPAPRRPRVGVFGRPFPGERISGDDAAFSRGPDALLVGLIDGLGHGDAARGAAVRAARWLTSHPDHVPQTILEGCDARLARTRGAVMTAARIEASGDLSIAGVGNVGARAYGVGAPWRFGGSSFVLGTPGGARRIAIERHRLAPRDVLVLFTDGIRSHFDLTGEHELLREHPIVVAQRVVERFARPDDDVLVMVVG
jgi:anti-sigma regulatory factor (Ser/Thr protein kinase)